MRTLTAAEENISAALVRRTIARVSVTDSGGTFRDLTTYPEANFVQSVEWNEAMDDAVSTATVTLRRAIGDRSLAPLHALSPLNHAFNPASSSAALLHVGRQVKIEAGVAVDGDSAPTAWNLVFHGYVDAIDWPGEDLVLECVGLEGKLRDTWIETERVYAYAQGANATKGVTAWAPTTQYGTGAIVIPSQARLNGHFYRLSSAPDHSDTVEPTWLTGSGAAVTDGPIDWDEAGTTSTTVGTAVETVMQQILDDNLGAGVVTLYTPTSPAWAVRFFAQRRESLLDALRTLAEQIGWALRYRFDSGTGTFRLTLFDPGRAKTTPDRTFAPSQVLDVSRCRVEIAEIRNAIRVVYPNSANVDPKGFPIRTTLDVTDATSIAKYGRRFMEISEDDASNLNTSTEATTLANAALSDLKEPTAEYSVEVAFFPWVQTCDLLRFSADNLHFTSAQDLAVVALSHSVSEDGSASTSVTTRGKPSIGVATWLRRDAGKGGTHQTTLHSSGDSFTATAGQTVAGATLAAVQGATINGFVQAFETHVGDTADFMPSSSSLVAASSSTETTLDALVPGKSYYAKMVPYTFNGQRHVRGLPSAAVAFTAGRTRCGHYDSTATQSHLPLNGNFEHASDNLANAPPDHWAISALGGESESWGSSGSVYYGTDAAKGRYVALRAHATQRGRIISSAFEVRRGLRALNIYLAIRRNGSSAASGKDLIVDVFGFSDAALTTQVINYSVFLSGDSAGPYPSLATWYEAVIDFGGGYGSVPNNVNFLQIVLRRGTGGDSSFSWDVGDVYVQEADFYRAAIDQPAWIAPTFATNWGDNGGGWMTAAYFKDSLGQVHLRGLVKVTTATLTATIFTLPAGYRPSATIQVPLRMGTNALSYLTIDSSGSVQYGGGVLADAQSGLSLDGITFDTR